MRLLPISRACGPRRFRALRLAVASILTGLLAVGSVPAAPAAAAGTWATPVSLTAASSENSTNPTIGVDLDGNRVVAWVHYNGSSRQLKWKYYTAATATWSTAMNLTASGNWYGNPEIAVSATGAMVVVWAERVEPPPSVNEDAVLKARYLDAGSTVWSAATTVSDPAADAYLNDVVVDAAGVVTAVWMAETGPATDAVRARRYDSDAGMWSSIVDITPPGQEGTQASARLDGAGNVFVTWRRRSSNDLFPMVARYSVPGGQWSTSIPLGEPGTPSGDLTLAVEDGGDAVAAWVQRQGTDRSVVAARFTTASGWLPSDPPTPVSSVVAQVEGLALVVDTWGRYTMLWSEDTGATDLLRTSTYTAGAWGADEWSAPVMLESVPEPHYDIEMGVDPTGNVTAVWERWDGLVQRVFGTRKAGGSWSSVQGLSATSLVDVLSLYADDQSLTIGPDRTAFVVWGRNNEAEFTTFTPTAAPVWTDTTVAGLQVGVAASEAIAASGSPAPRFSVHSGSLPAGISLNPLSGALTGTPTTAGNFSFTAFAENTGGTVAKAIVGQVAVPSPAGSDYTALTPARVMETRGPGTIDAQHESIGQLPPGSVYQLPIVGRAGVPAGTQAVAVTLTITEPTAPGFATAFPCGGTVPNASNINYTTGQTIATSALVKIGTAGSICIYTHAATHFIVDVNGAL